MPKEPSFTDVVAAAARLQELVPDAVLVGGTAAALFAGHRVSFDDDHVLADLGERFDDILGTLEASEGWVTERVRPGRVILGNLAGIDTGVLQLRRRRPLEVMEIEYADDRVRVPTDHEMLRVKAWMIVFRNATRDYLDVAALADRLGLDISGSVLARMDEYYEDQRGGGRGVATQLARMLADPRPYDFDEVDLSAYRRLEARWRQWHTVVGVCEQLATEILVAADDDTGS